MTGITPEDLAKEFARRWLSHESESLRELGERELVRLIRMATKAQRSEPKEHREGDAA